MRGLRLVYRRRALPLNTSATMPESVNFEGRRSKRSVYGLAPSDWTPVGDGHFVQQIVLSPEELQKDEHPMFHRCADAHNAVTASFHTIDGSQAVIGVTHAVQKTDIENPVPREPHPHSENVTYHHETPETRQVMQFHHVGVAGDGNTHTAVFLNTDHKASEIATLMNQEGMEGATAVRAPVVMQPTEGPHKGKFLYRKEPVMTDDGVNPAMVAFGNNAVTTPKIPLRCQPDFYCPVSLNMARHHCLLLGRVHSARPIFPDFLNTARHLDSASP